MVSGFVVLRWLTPDDLGLWQSVLLIQTYMFVFQFGALKGLARELPYRLGSKDPRAVEFASAAQTVSLIGAAMLVLGAGIAAFLLSGQERVSYSVPVVLLGSASSLYSAFLIVIYWAHRSFERLATIKLVMAAVNVGTLGLVYAFRYEGLVLRFLLLQTLPLALTFASLPMRVPVRWSWPAFVTLTKVGIPLFVFAYAIGIAKTFPRLILLHSGGPELVGYFAPAAAIIAVTIILPTAIGQYVGPNMSFRLGETGSPQSLWPAAWKGSVWFLVVSALPLLLASQALPRLVELLFPKYGDAAPAVVWVSIAGMFSGSNVTLAALRSLKAWRWLATFTVISVGCDFLVPAAATVVIQNPLEAVAFGYMIARGIAFGAALICSYVATHSSAYAAPRAVPEPSGETEALATSSTAYGELGGCD